jgi:TetR/AcrR family transcriptional regulator
MAGRGLRGRAPNAARTPDAGTAPNGRTRLSGQDRRASILSAATMVFAQHGYEGTKTLQIALAAGVSEALVFRHFPSKLSLYRAVLRQLIQDQDATFARFGSIEPSADGLVAILLRAVRHALQGGQANAESARLLIGSLAGDGGYARLVYRRSTRLVLPELRRALAAARAEGALAGEPVAPENIAAFVEHVGSLMLLARQFPQPAIRYAGDDEQLLRDAVLFCARGIGLREEVVQRHLETLREPQQA